MRSDDREGPAADGRSPDGVARWAFDRFEIDGHFTELRRDGDPVSLGPNALRLLRVLVERANAFVSKETILATVWPDTTVTIDSVYTTLRELRRGIGDDGAEQKLIETKRGRGYRLVPAARRIESARLSEDEIFARWEAKRGTSAPRILARRLFARTAGHAGCVDALIGGLASDAFEGWEAALAAGTIALPGALLDAAVEGLPALSPEDAHVLSVAAVLGTAFEVSLLAELLERSESSLADVLDRASRSGWIEPDPLDTRRLRFREPLFGEALEVALPDSERRRLHGEVASQIESRGGARDAVARSAAHWLRSDAAPAHVLAACRSAAETLSRIGRIEEAVLLLLGAARVAEALDFDDRARILDDLGEAYFGVGEPDAARETYARVIREARDRDDPVRFAMAVLGYSGARMHMDTAIASPRRVALLEEALAAADALPATLVAALEARLALDFSWFRRHAEAQQLCRSAVAAVRAGQVDDALASRVLHDAYWATWSPDDPEAREALAAEMQTLAERAGQSVMSAMASTLRAAAVLERGERIEAELAYAPASDLPTSEHAAIALFQSGRRACIALLEGRFEEAERLARQAHATARRFGSTNADAIYAAQIGWLRFDQERLEELEPVVSGMLGSPRFEQRAGRALILACAGRSTEAGAELQDLVAQVDAFPRDSFWLATLAMLVEVADVLGSAEAAARLRPLLLPYAGRTVLLGVRTVCRGSMELYLGLASRTMGQRAEAATHFERAAYANARLRAAPLLARALIAFAHALDAAGDAGGRTRAAEARAEGLRIRTQLGLGPGDGDA